MSSISIEEIKQDVDGFLKRIATGERIRITKENWPVAEVKPMPPKAEGMRPFGLAKGEFVVPDDFDAPLPDEILRAFHAI